jgi:hypothetical protein
MSFDLNTELARRHGEDGELLISLSNLRFSAVVETSGWRDAKGGLTA